jgi:hypothetical protein
MFQYAPDLWQILVEYTFGGFWLSVIGLVVVFGVILMIGGLSGFSTMIFILAFILAMTMGYGYPLITVPLWTFLVGWSIFQVYKLISQSS